MSRKLLATLLLVVAATFAAPMAANATSSDDYTSDGGCSINPTTVMGGESATLNCDPGTFGDSEGVTYVVSGQDGADAHLASFSTSVASTATVVKTAAPDGSAELVVTVPRTASGAYQITGTGNTTHASTTATITVIPADDPASSTTTSSGSGSGLADTGSIISTSLLSVGVVLVLAGVILAFIVRARRRREPTGR
jgi:hypothetical protein